MIFNNICLYCVSLTLKMQNEPISTVDADIAVKKLIDDKVENLDQVVPEHNPANEMIKQNVILKEI